MKNKLFLGSLFSAMSAISYSTQASIIKGAISGIPLPVMVFIQSLICLILILPIIVIKNGSKTFQYNSFSKVKKQHFMRTVFSLGISYFLFASLKYMPFLDSVLLYNTFPLFVPIVAFAVLKTKIDKVLYPFILLGFIGAALTMNVDGNIFSFPATYGLLSAICAAFSIVFMRKISKSDDSLKSLYHYFLYSTIISGFVSVPYLSDSGDINFKVLLLIGFMFFIVQYFLTLAATYTTPTVVSMVYYLNIIVSLIISICIFNFFITNKIAIGMILIVAGGLSAIYLQTKRKRYINDVLDSSLTLNSKERAST